MNSMSSLLQEAKPLYLKNKRERRMCIRYGFATALALLVITPPMLELLNDQISIDSLYAQLYTSSQSEGQTSYFVDEFDALGVI